MFNFGGGKLSIKMPDGGWVDLGPTSAVAFTSADGTQSFSGEPEGVFNLRLTDSDREFLREIESAFKE